MEKTTINDLRKGDRIAVRDHNGKQVPMFIENIRVQPCLERVRITLKSAWVEVQFSADRNDQIVLSNKWHCYHSAAFKKVYILTP